MEKILAIMVVIGLAAGCAKAEEGRITFKAHTDVVHIKCSMTSKIVTNEISEAEYNVRTNGYIKVDEMGRAWANNIIWVGSNNYNIAMIVCATNYATYGWVAQNQAVANAPDPFKEKITIKYFTAEREDTYVLHVGPLKTDFACVKTVLSRWKTRHVQKLNMIESTEKVIE